MSGVMLELMMFAGMGFLAGCVVTMTVIPLVHERAVRLTTKRLMSATPATVNEVHAQKDLQRAEYAVALRRLEISAGQARAHSIGARLEAGRKAVEALEFKAELGRATALLRCLHAREQTHRQAARRVVRLVAYLFDRSQRERRRIFLAGAPRSERMRDWATATASS
jgi:hypothetical protein